MRIDCAINSSDNVPDKFSYFCSFGETHPDKYRAYRHGQENQQWHKGLKFRQGHNDEHVVDTAHEIRTDTHIQYPRLANSLGGDVE